MLGEGGSHPRVLLIIRILIYLRLPVVCRVNSLAQRGEYEGPHPSVLSGKSLHETHRGWSGQPGEEKKC